MPERRERRFQAYLRIGLYCALLGPIPLSADVAKVSEDALAPDYEFSTITIKAQGDSGLAKARVTAEDLRLTNAVNTEDAIRYLPSVIVRKRYIGDLNGLVQLRGTGNFQTTRIKVTADDALLLSYYLQTRFKGAPRWSLVSPQELLSAEIHYGAYRAVDSGNAMAGSIDLLTKQPTHRFFELSSAYFLQDFSLYGDHSSPEGRRLHLGYGDRFGALSFYVFYDHQVSSSQPMMFYSSPVGSPAGQPQVRGAYRDRDTFNKERITYGDQGPDHSEMNLFKVKLGYDLGDFMKIQLQLGTLERMLWIQDKKNYLRDASGQTLWGDGNNATLDAVFQDHAFNVDPAQFGPSVADRQDLIGALGFKGGFGEGWDYAASLSAYLLLHDLTQQSNRNPSDPAYDGSGLLNDFGNVGWCTADLKVGKRDWFAEGLSAYAGGHVDSYSLRANTYASADWKAGDKKTWLQSSGGSTQTLAAFGQAEWEFLQGLSATLGGRFERWLAFGSYSNSPSLWTSNAPRQEDRFSPKATLKVVSGGWSLGLGAAKAYRFPIIEELYQSSFTLTNVNLPDKSLRPENGSLFSVTAENRGAWGSLQVTLFRDEIRDAIIYQTDISSSPNVTTYQNVDRTLTQGIELVAARKGLLSVWDLSGNLSWLDPRVMQDRGNPDCEGKVLPLTAQVRAALLNSVHLSSQLSATLATRYFSRQFARLDNADIHSDTYGGESGALVFDLHLDFQPQEGWAFGIGVDNLFSERYFDVHPYPQRSYFANIDLKF